MVVGGAAGKSVRKADLLITVETTEEALEAGELFFQYYRENGNYLERTYDFVERLGIEKIRKETVYAPEEEKRKLLDRLQRSKALSQDAWLERDRPSTPRNSCKSSRWKGRRSCNSYEPWTKITRVENIPPREGRAVKIGDLEIAIFNLNGRFLTIENACPHKGGPLCDGIVTGTAVVCPLHGRHFDLETGMPVRASEPPASPCSPRAWKTASFSSILQPVTRRSDASAALAQASVLEFPLNV